MPKLVKRLRNDMLLLGIIIGIILTLIVEFIIIIWLGWRADKPGV